MVINESLESKKNVVDAWFNFQKEVLPAKALYSIKELITNELTFSVDMQNFRNGLEVMRFKMKKNKNRDIVDNYITQMGTLLESYARLDFLNAVSHPENDLNSVLSSLQKKYESDDFSQCMNTLTKLMVAGKKIDEIYTQYEKSLKSEDLAVIKLMNKTLNRGSNQLRSLSDYTIMPLQKITRFQMPLENTIKNIKELNDKSNSANLELSISSAETSLKTIKEHAKNANAALDPQNHWIVQICKEFINKINLISSHYPDPVVRATKLTEQLTGFSRRLITQASETDIERNTLKKMLDVTQVGIKRLSNLFGDQVFMNRVIDSIAKYIIINITTQSDIIIAKNGPSYSDKNPTSDYKLRITNRGEHDEVNTIGETVKPKVP